MKLINLIFALVHKFVPIPDNDFAKLKREAEDWETVAMDEENENRDGIQKMYGKIHESWFVRLGFAIAYMPAVNYLMNIGKPDEEEDE